MAYANPGQDIKASQINLLHALNCPLYVQATKQGVDILTKYSESQDIKFTIRKMSVNQTYQLGDISSIENSEMTVSDDFSNETTKLYEQYTDMVAPWFELLAVNDIDGDNAGVGMYTGGWHGFDNKNSGTPTAKSDSIVCFADGIQLLENQQRYCRELKVIVTNLIQGGNTKKEDGSGRAILKEIVTYTFCGTSIHVEVAAEALEDLTISQYYFLQFQRVYGFEKRFLVVGDNTQKKWIDEYEIDIDGGSVPDNLVTRMIFEGEENVAEMEIDPLYGIGTLCLNDQKMCWHHRNFGKAYWNFIFKDSKKPFVMKQGELLHCRGAYHFRKSK